jgi:hypothetical protein
MFQRHEHQNSALNPFRSQLDAVHILKTCLLKERMSFSLIFSLPCGRFPRGSRAEAFYLFPFQPDIQVTVIM